MVSGVVCQKVAEVLDECVDVMNVSRQPPSVHNTLPSHTFSQLTAYSHLTFRRPHVKGSLYAPSIITSSLSLFCGHMLVNILIHGLDTAMHLDTPSVSS